jgi:hypothetical protein
VVTYVFVAVHKYLVCAPKSGQLISWLVNQNHSHYLLEAETAASLQWTRNAPLAKNMHSEVRGLAVHLNWSASCKSGSQSLRHQDLHLLNIHPAITTTSPNYNSNLEVPRYVFPCTVAKGLPTSYHTEQEDNDDAFIGAAFKDSRHIGGSFRPPPAQC